MTNKHYAIAGLIAPILFWLTYIILSNLRPEYSFLTKAVSELGSLDAPNKWTWNVLGYSIPGLLISFFSFGLFKSISKSEGNKWQLYGIFLSGAFMAVSGIFPGDFDNRQSLTMLLHTIGSFGSYIFFLVGAFSYPIQMRKSGYWKSAVTPTILFTCSTILFGAWPFVFPQTPGVGQRFVFFFYFLWIFYTAYKLLKTQQVANA